MSPGAKKSVPQNSEPSTSQNTECHTSSTTILNTENIPPLVCSCRLVFAVCAFVALFNMSILRFNLSFAVVCMVQSEVANKTLRTIQMNCSTATYAADTYDRESEFHWSKSQQGRVLGGFFYGFLSSQTVGGWISDRWGGRRPFILGNFLQGFLALMMPAAARWTPEALFVLRIMQGIACGLSVPAFFQLGARWTAPKERTLLMGLAVSGFPVANIAIYPVAAFLCDHGMDGGWPSIFYTTGTFGAGCALFSYFFIYDIPNEHPRISDQERSYLNSVTIQGKKPIKLPWKHCFTSGPVIAYFVSHFCFTWGYVTIAIHLPLFMDQVMLFDRNMNGLLSSVPFIGILVSRIIVSSTFHPCQMKSGLNSSCKRKLNHTIGTLFVALCLFGVSMMSCRQRIEAVFLLAAGMAVAELAYTGGYGFTLLQLVPRLAGTLSGTANALANSSGIICPLIVAMVTPNGTQEEWAIVLYITSALYIIQCITYVIFGSVELLPWAKEDEPVPGNSTVKNV